MKLFDFLARMLDPDVDDTHLKSRLAPVYRQVNQKIGLVLALWILVAASFLAVLAAQSKDVIKKVYSISPEGRIVPVEVLSMPVYSSARVRDWAEEAVKEIYTVNFANVEEKTAHNMIYFTPHGRALFKDAGKDQADVVTSKHLEVVLTPLSPPYIVGQWKQPGGMSVWKVEIDVMLIYQGSFGDRQKGPIVKHQVAALTILQVPTTDTPSGIAIASLTLNEPMK